MVSRFTSRKSFTLIELLIVLAIVAILSVVVILTLNPSELLKQSRDSTRLSDLATLNTALGAYNADVTGGFMGTSSMVYVSIPDTTSTCVNLGLPTLPAGYTYNCVSTSTLKNANGTGWIPVNFTQISFGSPLSNLPVDPINTTSSGNYYTYVSGGSWILTALPESAKQKTNYQSNPAIPNYPGVIAYGTNMTLSPLFNPNGLLGWWKLDGVNDSSGQGNNGSGQGGIVVGGGSDQHGWSNKSTFFTSPQRITNIGALPTYSFIQNTMIFTASAWIKVASPPPAIERGFMGNNGGTSAQKGFDWTWNSSSLQRIDFTVTDGAGVRLLVRTTNGSVADSNWHHLVVSSDGITGRSYIDGIANNTGAVGTLSTGDSSQLLTIGYYATTTGQWEGNISDARLYNRALSAAEVQALYNATK